MTAIDDSRSTPFVLAIDVEPDDGLLDRRRPQPWRGFELTYEYLSALRERLVGSTGRAVHFNWFLRMDPQIGDVYGDHAWAAATYGTQLEKLRAEGDEIGLHPHGWRWKDPPGQWVHEHGDPQWLSEVVLSSFDAFERAFGVRCMSHRFGQRFVSAGVVRDLQERGVKVDLTVEPGARGVHSLNAAVAATGSIPDQQHAPRYPYRPSSWDPLEPSTGDGRGLWMLPMTAFDPAPGLPLWRRVARRIRFAGRPRHRPAELWSPMQPGLFWSLTESALAEMAVPYVYLVVRSDMILRRGVSDAMTGKLEMLSRSPLARRLSFVRATEAIERLTGERR